MTAIEQFRQQWSVRTCRGRIPSALIIVVSPRQPISPSSPRSVARKFERPLVCAALRRGNIIQARTVILIALIRLSRKLVILDPDIGPAETAALPGAMLALGMTCWLLRERDDRLAREAAHGSE